MLTTTTDIPDFVYNRRTRAARIGSQAVLPTGGISQKVNGYGHTFITLTIPVARVIVEDDPTGPVSPADPIVTVRP